MEKVTHSKPNSIWLFDYTSLASLDVCQDRIVCLSERDLNIIWQAIKDIDRFRSRVFTEKQGDVYTKVDPDQFEEFQFWVSDLNVHLGDYDVCNELLERIAIALETMSGAGCCTGGGAGGAGSTQAPPNTFDDSGEGIASYPGTYPSYNAFKQNKCNMSWQIVWDMVGDFTAISNIFPSGQTIASLATLLAGALVTPVPFDDILALAALILFQPFQATFLFETGYQMYNGSENDEGLIYYFDQLICGLYSSNDATEAYSTFRNYMVAHVIGERPWTDGEKGYVTGFLDSIWRMDSANQLFDGTPSREIDTRNCTFCDGDSWWVCSFGDIRQSAYGQVIIKAAVAGDGDYEAALGTDGSPQIWNTYLDEGEPDTPVSVPSVITRWSDAEGSGAGCTASNEDPQWNEVLDTFQTGSYPSVNAIAWRSSTPFTIVIQNLSI